MAARQSGSTMSRARLAIRCTMVSPTTRRASRMRAPIAQMMASAVVQGMVPLMELEAVPAAGAAGGGEEGRAAAPSGPAGPGGGAGATPAGGVDAPRGGGWVAG